MAQIQSLAWECPHVMGVAKKKEFPFHFTSHNYSKPWCWLQWGSHFLIKSIYIFPQGLSAIISSFVLLYHKPTQFKCHVIFKKYPFTPTHCNHWTWLQKRISFSLTKVSVSFLILLPAYCGRRSGTWSHFHQVPKKPINTNLNPEALSQFLKHPESRSSLNWTSLCRGTI